MENPSLGVCFQAVCLLLIIKVLCSATVDGRLVHVVPDVSTQCETAQVQCLTFTESLQRATEVFVSESTVVFSAGEFIIPGDSISSNLTVTLATNLALNGPHPPGGQVAHIICHGRFRFEFVDSNYITIANIVFTGCGSRSQSGSGTLIFTNVVTLTLAHVTVQDSYGYGLVGSSLSGQITIFNATFLNNSKREGYQNQFRRGGNCFLLIRVTNGMFRFWFIPPPTSVTISESWFVNGIAGDAQQGLQVSGGLAISLMQGYFQETGPLKLFVVNCMFLNNSAPNGGNLLLGIYNWDYPRSSYEQGNGSYDYEDPYILRSYLDVSLAVSNCTFKDG